MAEVPRGTFIPSSGLLELWKIWGRYITEVSQPSSHAPNLPLPHGMGAAPEPSPKLLLKAVEGSFQWLPKLLPQLQLLLVLA